MLICKSYGSILEVQFLANIRSSEKDIRRSEKRRVRNLEVKSAVRTYIRLKATTAARYKSRLAALL
mgnify:CR=1 FL=1